VTTEYDAEIIRQQADLLYAEADRAVLASMIITGILGILVGSASFYFLSEHEALSIVLVLGVPIAGAALGALLGDGRAFRLRAQAQQLLVLVAIEQNTRKAPAPPAPPTPIPHPTPLSHPTPLAHPAVPAHPNPPAHPTN
jgi:uncharacterized integral membrane protein